MQTKYFSLRLVVLFFCIISLCSNSLLAQDIEPTNYLDDNANIISDEYVERIVENAAKVENTMRIRILVKTEVFSDMSTVASEVESFFSNWIRSINLEKRGILIYAALPEDRNAGTIHLRVGMGLKYIITREMGEKILNEIIIPGNAENQDGQGFYQGIATFRNKLVDELHRERQRRVSSSDSFSLRNFVWKSKEIIIAILVVLFICYLLFFVERCPRCNSSLKITTEPLKEPGETTLGMNRKFFTCEHCGFTRRKKEPVYPRGLTGWKMRLTGTQRNVKID